MNKEENKTTKVELNEDGSIDIITSESTVIRVNGVVIVKEPPSPPTRP